MNTIYPHVQSITTDCVPECISNFTYNGYDFWKDFSGCWKQKGRRKWIISELDYNDFKQLANKK